MKRFKIFVFSIVLVLGVSGAASATTLTDITLFTATGTDDAGDYVSHGRGDVNFLSSPIIHLFPPAIDFDYVTWNHLFTFDPPAGQILSGTLKIYLRDDNEACFWPEFAFGWTESGEWDFGEVDTENYIYDVGVNILADGVFRVTIASLEGDFYIEKSELTIDYTAVPEPTTILLLGFGLLGVAGIRRRMR